MLVTLLTTMILVIVVVMIHCEALKRVSDFVGKLPRRPRLNVGLGVVGALLAHLVKVVVFAVGLNILIRTGRYGELQGMTDLTSSDVMHFSMVAYTSIGYGDIIPVGPLRFFAGMETLTGLVLVAWTASFMYLQMSKYWRLGDDTAEANDKPIR